ncbi:MAG: hypothetical protein HOJ21_16500 [Alphaproteobacteria bacterium]|nr:hypothetical protein [Alphaproteobacteria bacterium]
MLSNTDSRSTNNNNKGAHEVGAGVTAAGMEKSGVLLVGGDMLFREGLKRLLQTAPFTLEGESE